MFFLKGVLIPCIPDGGVPSHSMVLCTTLCRNWLSQFLYLGKLSGIQRNCLDLQGVLQQTFRRDVHKRNMKGGKQHYSSLLICGNIDIEVFLSSKALLCASQRSMREKWEDESLLNLFPCIPRVSFLFSFFC